MLKKLEKEMILTIMKRKANISRNKLYAKVSQQPVGTESSELLKEIDARNKTYALILQINMDEQLAVLNEVLKDFE